MDQPQTDDQHTLTADTNKIISGRTIGHAVDHCDAGAIVLGIQELLEEVLKYLPPGALLRNQRVCKNWHCSINKYAHFKRSLFLLPVEPTEAWEIDRRAAHKHSHSGHEEVVLGKKSSNAVNSKWKLPITCRICESRELPRPEEHQNSMLLPIQFNPLFCDERREDTVDGLDERASRPACAEINLLEWNLRTEELRPWQNMLLTQRPFRHVRVQVSAEHEGVLGGFSAVNDSFVFSDPEGVRLGQVVDGFKKLYRRHLEIGEIYFDYVMVFVQNAVEVMEGDERDVERRTKARNEEVSQAFAAQEVSW
ncbi:hypothetical protein DOTSEDRAFT_21007 [Dothistroma septosporum NZE10]|uniref:F-box domain-containing protein n=1 Tax=Dothistroma septosporum (strain NZE10 / CBS 128990) TaxID=675120 RepID=N1PXT7_DOTSN|nr:hypothetical protein DOTSEDRAFT_21007 [Dothistroma septosporum NZE10]